MQMRSDLDLLKHCLRASKGYTKLFTLAESKIRCTANARGVQLCYIYSVICICQILSFYFLRSVYKNLLKILRFNLSRHICKGILMYFANSNTNIVIQLTYCIFILHFYSMCHKVANENFKLKRRWPNFI